MWEKLLSDIRKVEGKYGDTLNTPASNEQIELLKKIVKENWKRHLKTVFFDKVQPGK